MILQSNHIGLVLLLLSFLAFIFFSTDIEIDSTRTGQLGNEETYGRLNDKDYPLFLKELEKAGIKYRINERNFVVHNVKDTATVSAIARKVHFGPELNPNIYELLGYSGEKNKEFILDQLTQQGIKYIVMPDETYPGTGAINYSQIHGPKVDVIKQKVAEKCYEIR